jgi:hypothetical protein
MTAEFLNSIDAAKSATRKAGQDPEEILGFGEPGHPDYLEAPTWWLYHPVYKGKLQVEAVALAA